MAMELTPFRRGKLLNQFRALDRDSDGRVSRDDFTGVARRICGIFDIDVTSQAGQELFAAHTGIFDQICGATSSGVTFDEFLQGAEATLLSHEGSVKSIMTPMLRAVIRWCDSEGDKELSSSEFRRLLWAWGQSEEHALAAFNSLDLDKGSQLSEREMLEALEEFYLSEDPHAPGNTLFGPLEESRQSTARIPYPDPKALPEELARALAALPQLNIFLMMSHSPTMFQPIIQMAKAIYTELELPGTLRELAILLTAKILGCTYVWTQHVSVGQHEGLARAKIVAVRDGRLTAPCLTEVEQATLAFTSDVMHGVRDNDAAFGSMAKHLPPRQIVELLLTVGSYTMFSRLVTSLNIDLDRAAGDRVAESLAAS